MIPDDPDDELELELPDGEEDEDGEEQRHEDGGEDAEGDERRRLQGQDDVQKEDDEGAARRVEAFCGLRSGFKLFGTRIGSSPNSRRDCSAISRTFGLSVRHSKSIRYWRLNASRS